MFLLGIMAWFGSAALCYLMATITMAMSGVRGGWVVFAYGALGILALFAFIAGFFFFEESLQ